MNRKLYGLLLAAACLAALSGCKQDAQVESVIGDMDSFTKELVAKVEGAANPSAGVDDAQKYFDSRKAEMESKLATLKGLRGFQVSEATQKKMAESMTDDVMSVSKLQIKYIQQSMRDPAFKAKLEKLVNDYQSLWKSVGT